MVIGSVRSLALALGAAALLFSSPARAQSVEAETLFQAGKKLCNEGNYAEGAEKLEASDRLEPSVGTELNLGNCLEKGKKLASAWAAFLKAASNAKKAGNDKKREEEARKRAAALEPRLSYLTISVPDGNKVEGLTIMRNGAAVDSALWNTGVPVDEGTYEITGQAPGHEAWSTKVTVTGEGSKASVEVPKFKSIEDLVPDDPKPDDPKPDDPKPDDPRPDDPIVDGGERPGMFTTKRKIAVGVAAVGVAGIAVSVVFGLQAKDLQSQSDELCPEAACGDPMAIALNEDAQSAALKSNIFLGVGIAAIAGGAVLWFLGGPDDAPSSSSSGDDEEEEASLRIQPVIGPDRVTVSLGGRF